MFDLAANQNLRLFIKHDDNNYEKVSCALDTSLQDTGLYDNQLLLVDVQNVDGSWNIEEKRRQQMQIICKIRNYFILYYLVVPSELIRRRR